LKIKREDFVPPESKELAYLNEVLPLGFDQTISQPLVVSFYVRIVTDLKLGIRFWKFGAGSGWATALLAYLVQPKGKVIALEIIPELAKFGEENVKNIISQKEK